MLLMVDMGWLAAGAFAAGWDRMEEAMKIEIQQGDITEADVDAIVNAANTDLILGAGVAGAIRRKGGESIQRECNAIGGVNVGEVAVTGAGQLRQKHILHAATMMPGAPRTGQAVVEACVRNALNAADRLGCRSVAFPALGAGVAGLTLEVSARAIIQTALDWARVAESVELVVCVLFDEDAREVFEDEMRRADPLGEPAVH
jgi:O-acetyl-ADP-ribose deacetylase